MTDDELFERLRRELKTGWIPIPNEQGWQGTDAPGKLLRHRLGFVTSGRNRPNAEDWHIFFNGGTSEISLGGPEGSFPGVQQDHLDVLLHRFGGGVSYSATIHRQSGDGFYVVSEGGAISLRNDSHPDLILPTWKRISLEGWIERKYKRLIVVEGEVRGQRGQPRTVSYSRAHAFLEPDVEQFAKAASDGAVSIDLSIGAHKNHGVRFRVPFENLTAFYGRHIPL